MNGGKLERRATGTSASLRSLGSTTGRSQPPAPVPAPAPAPASASASAPRRRSFKESRELERLEQELAQWEERRRELEGLLGGPAGGDYTRLEALTQELAALLERIADGEERWLVLSDLTA